jgi:hypothetical protein
MRVSSYRLPLAWLAIAGGIVQACVDQVPETQSSTTEDASVTDAAPSDAASEDRHDFGEDAPPAHDAAAERKRIFITNQAVNGALGGLTGADGICQKAAEAAKLGGRWVAWLASPAAPAIDRVTGTGPWYDVRQIDLIFTGKTTGASPMTGIVPATPITRNENGQAFDPAVWYWTGTTADRALGDHCNSWASASAGLCGDDGVYCGYYTNSGQAGQFWAGQSRTSCNALNHLLCIEN